MFNKDLTFHSSRDYPVIVASNSVAISKAFGPSTTSLTPMSASSPFLVFEETAGWRSVVAGPSYKDSSGNQAAFISGGQLYCYLDGVARSGKIYWRQYGT